MKSQLLHVGADQICLTSFPMSVLAHIFSNDIHCTVVYEECCGTCHIVLLSCMSITFVSGCTWIYQKDKNNFKKS